jgi:hypothetical protein
MHNWESGLDASPAYDPAFHTYITTLNETALLMEYPKFLEIAESYKFLYHWNVTAILGRDKSPDSLTRLDNWFLVKDAAVNCVYASGWHILSLLAKELDDIETANYCESEYRVSRNAIVNKMWRDDLGRFQTLYIDNDGIEKVSVANTVQNLFPILLYDLPTLQLQHIISELSNSQTFSAPYSIPTVAMNDPQFSATFEVDLMWRGPVCS